MSEKLTDHRQATRYVATPLTRRRFGLSDVGWNALRVERAIAVARALSFALSVRSTSGSPFSIAAMSLALLRCQRWMAFPVERALSPHF